MEKAWSVRAYTTGDENGIFDLMKAVYPEKNLSKDSWMRWWQWMFTQCPAGAARIFVADHKGKIIGQYPLILANIKIGEKIQKASQNIELMTHPEYRHQGMFFALENQALSKTSTEGITITYGFPNAAAYPGHIKTGWFDIGSLHIGIKPLNIKKLFQTTSHNWLLTKIYTLAGKIIVGVLYREKRTPKVSGVTISQITCFDDRVTSLWKKISHEYEILVVRDKDYLNWRYVNIPDVTYTIFAAEKQGELVGYVVIRCIQEEHGIIAGTIFDILAPRDQPEIYSALLTKATNYCTQEHADLLVGSMLAPRKLRKIFKSKGFIFSRLLLKGFMETSQFCAYTSDPTLSKDLLVDEEKWFIQIGDSDTL